MLDSFDFDRLFRDAAYAGSVADSLRVVQAVPGGDPDLRWSRQRVLTYALAAASRETEAEAAGEEAIRLGAARAASYTPSIFAARRANRHTRAVDLIDRAARAAADPAQRAALIASLTPEDVAWDLRGLRRAQQNDARNRLAEVLLRIGWPGPAEPTSTADALRMILVDRSLERGDVAAAAATALDVSGIGDVLLLITARRYDPVVASTDRLARLRDAIAQEDQLTTARLAAAPEDVERLVERATFLRSVGRDRDVLALLMPLMANPRLIVSRHPQGLWIVNEAAYSLIATGETQEAIELMRPLASMDVETNPELVSAIINYAGMLWEVGRAQEALQEAERISDIRYASDYGRMWIWAGGVCSATDLQRGEEAAEWMRRMQEKAGTNHAAMIQAHLCRGEFEAGERVLLAALAGEAERDTAILWLQHFESRTAPPAAVRMREGFARLRARPAVQAALAPIGHTLRLPLPPTRYGWY